MRGIALTGHRQNRIVDTARMYRTVQRFFESWQPSFVVNGLANGFDLYAAEIAVNLDIPVISAKPWAGHGPNKLDDERYKFVIEHSKEVHVVNESQTYPGPWVYQKRNEFMVDYPDVQRVMAYWDGEPKGGTYNCIEYAWGKRVDVYNTFPDLIGACHPVQTLSK